MYNDSWFVASCYSSSSVYLKFGLDSHLLIITPVDNVEHEEQKGEGLQEEHVDPESRKSGMSLLSWEEKWEINHVLGKQFIDKDSVKTKVIPFLN